MSNKFSLVEHNLITFLNHRLINCDCWLDQEYLKSTDSRWRYLSNKIIAALLEQLEVIFVVSEETVIWICLSYFRQRRPIWRPSSRSCVNRLWAHVNSDSGEMLMCSCCMRSERNTRELWSHKPRKVWFRLSLGVSRSLLSPCTPRPACDDQRTTADKLKEMCAV